MENNKCENGFNINVEKTITDSMSVYDALQMADSFNLNKSIPRYAMALKALAGRVRMQKKILEKLNNALNNF